MIRFDQRGEPRLWAQDMMAWEPSGTMLVGGTNSAIHPKSLYIYIHQTKAQTTYTVYDSFCMDVIDLYICSKPM